MVKKENPRKTFLNFRNNLVMLYKNLPQEDLASVMRVRAVLDYVAAFSFMLKGRDPLCRLVQREPGAGRAGDPGLCRPTTSSALPSP